MHVPKYVDLYVGTYLIHHQARFHQPFLFFFFSRCSYRKSINEPFVGQSKTASVSEAQLQRMEPFHCACSRLLTSATKKEKKKENPRCATVSGNTPAPPADCIISFSINLALHGEALRSQVFSFVAARRRHALELYVKHTAAGEIYPSADVSGR